MGEKPQDVKNPEPSRQESITVAEQKLQKLQEMLKKQREDLGKMGSPTPSPGSESNKPTSGGKIDSSSEEKDEMVFRNPLKESSSWARKRRLAERLQFVKCG